MHQNQEEKKNFNLRVFLEQIFFLSLVVFFEYMNIIQEHGNGKFLRLWIGTLPVVLFHKPDELEVKSQLFAQNLALALVFKRSSLTIQNSWISLLNII